MNPGDIHWVELPNSATREQVGRRPAIILQDEEYGGRLPMVIVIPLTSATGATRFAGTLLIEASPENGLRNASVALAFQIRAVDRKNVRERLGVITPEQLDDLYNLVDRLTGRELR